MGRPVIEGGIFPRPIDIVQPPMVVRRASLDARSRSMERYAQPQNHSSRDRGLQLKVNPIAGAKYGNKR